MNATIRRCIAAAWAEAHAMTNEERAEAGIATIYTRDRSERGYEDIGEYQKVIERPVAGLPEASVEQMTGRPFGCVVQIEGGRYRVSVTRRSLDMVEVGPRAAKREGER